MAHPRGRVRAYRGRGRLWTHSDARAQAAAHELHAQAAVRPGGLRALMETTKPRITRLVTITSLVGFAAAASTQAWSWGQLLVTVLGCAAGTACSAAGANAVNQFIERDLDVLMPRTRSRPLPEGRSEPRVVLAWGVALGVAGVAILLTLCGWVPALVSAVCYLVYVAIYTPLKTRTTLATYVGAIPGALPPLIGWSAARAAGGETSLVSLLEPGGLSLFALMSVWQLPHFFAIAWLYREDYALGGFKMVAVDDPDGTRTARTVGLWTFLLVPATLAPYWLMGDVVGPVYFGVAAVTGLVFAWLAAKLMKTRSRRDARRLFIASVIHLPLILMTLVGEALFRALV